MPEINEISDCERKNEPSTYIEGQYNVSDSILCNFSSRAIYFNTTDTNSRLFIECCSFSYDTSNDYGGAVYFGDTGEIVFSRVNGIYCSCNDSLGHFSYTVTKNPKSSLNNSSLFSCSTEKKGTYTSHFESVCQKISDTNISDCKGKNTGVIYFKSSSKSFVQLSNLYNQTADYHSYAFSRFDSGLKTIKCNYIRNSVGYLITSEGANFFVENCNILNNTAKVLFYAQYGGDITVINCCLFESNSYTYLTLGYSGYSFNLDRMNGSSCPQEFHFEPVFFI